MGAAPRFLIHDRDTKYGTEVPAAIRSVEINPLRTSFENPCQNGVAERWMGSCHRAQLDHLIALNEAAPEAAAFRVSPPLSRRPHAPGLGKETPGCRIRCRTSGRVLSHDRPGGLHTVILGRPSPKTFPSILNNMCVLPCRCVSRREAQG